MPVYGFPDRASYDRMASAVRQAGDLPARRGSNLPRDPILRIRLAKTTASHAAGAEQAVNLCKPDFTEYSPARPIDAVNDSLVTIPSGTKVYISRFAGKTRILVAFVCTE